MFGISIKANTQIDRHKNVISTCRCHEDMKIVFPTPRNLNNERTKAVRNGIIISHLITNSPNDVTRLIPPESHRFLSHKSNKHDNLTTLSQGKTRLFSYLSRSVSCYVTKHYFSSTWQPVNLLFHCRQTKIKWATGAVRRFIIFGDGKSSPSNAYKQRV